jgi:hypothetical protein
MALGEDWRLWMCLWSVYFALVLSIESGKLGWLEWWWLGGIYSPTNILAVGCSVCRWAHRTVLCAPDTTIHCPVCATSADCWGLELLSVEFVYPFGAPDSPVRPDVVDCLLTSDALDCSAVDRSRPLAKLTVALWAHRTVRWFLVEERFDSPRAPSSWSAPAWAPDSPVRHRLVQICFAPNL